MISLEQFQQLFPKCYFKNNDLNEFYQTLLSSSSFYKITEGNRFNYFLAQCAHESMGFSTLEECLNYSADSLLKLWPKRFTKEEAEKYARHPMMIANRIYANRMGNSSEESGDGWRYKGAGCIQLTGRTMQTNYQKSCPQTNFLVPISELLATRPFHSINSACWFWSTINANELADYKKFKEITLKINGGLNGLDDRLKWLNRIEQLNN